MTLQNAFGEFPDAFLSLLKAYGESQDAFLTLPEPSCTFPRPFQSVQNTRGDCRNAFRNRRHIAKQTLSLFRAERWSADVSFGLKAKEEAIWVACRGDVDQRGGDEDASGDVVSTVDPKSLN
jgi:hypothetical protein